MSAKRPVSRTVVEWSPTQVSWIGPDHRLVVAASFADAAPLVPSREVVVAVSRRTAFIRASWVPNAPKPDIRRILAMQVGQLFPISAEELAFDFHLTSETGPEGRLAVIAAMRSADLHSMLDQAKAAGFHVLQVVPSALGAPLVAKSLDQANGAVVQRTAEGLAIDLVVNGELRYSREAAMPATSIGIDAEVGRTFAAGMLGCSPTIAAGALALTDADYSTDLSSLAGLAGAHLDIHIDTPEQIEIQARRDANRRLTVATVVFLLTLIPAGYRFLVWNEAQQAADRTLAGYNFKSTKLKRDRDAAITKNNTAQNLKLIVDRGFRPAQAITDIVTLVTADAPTGVWLTGFSIERGKPITLRGTATRGEAVSEYQATLVGESRLRDVKLLFASNAEIDKNPVVQFSISAFPVGNLPLLDSTTKKGATK